jgi:hypothetical protein
MIKSYDKKLVVSGKIVEFYQYKDPVFYNHTFIPNPSGRGSPNVSTDDKVINREKVLNRAKRDLRRLINANVYMYSGFVPKFVTFTFSDNVKDLDYANYEWKKFIQRFKYYLDKDVKYVVVIEFQKRGAIHYHAIFFNIPYVRSDILKNLWGNGFIKINKIDDVDNIGAYVTKYMTKDSNDNRLEGRKSYFCSRGLYKPIEIYDKNKIDGLLSHLSEKKVYENVFENDYNTIIYKQYNMNKNV